MRYLIDHDRNRLQDRVILAGRLVNGGVLDQDSPAPDSPTGPSASVMTKKSITSPASTVVSRLPASRTMASGPPLCNGW